MDLVSRLKRYLDYRQISVTQFADECNIPRPTGSQLLAGRNKKVSDEIIGKIHLAYPELNIVWLMFGEGNMVTDENIKISAPQNGAKDATAEAEVSISQPIDFGVDFNENIVEEEEENNPDSQTANTFTFSTPAASVSEEEQSARDSAATNESQDEQPARHATSRNGKRVTGIVVYYDDNTYESFIPDPNHGHPFMR